MDVWQWLRFQRDNKQNERGSQGGEKKARKGSQEKYPGHPWIILDTTFVPMGNPHDN
jgi:hypothetical protein